MYVQGYIGQEPTLLFATMLPLESSEDGFPSQCPTVCDANTAVPFRVMS